jgi:UDP-N-acetylmuramoyl-L-alanyl-D-glutamate--2,6-diaminopimelate ligase
MGKIASDHADILILSNDNPRSEPPSSIIDDIMNGIQKDSHVELDRKTAIGLAMSMVKKDDLLLVAGKGDERVMEVGDERIPFHDRSVVESILKEGLKK